jgi:hypothetical protein
LISVESTPKLANAFTHSYKDWKDGTYENFKEWAVQQFGNKELDSEEEVDVPVHFTKAKNISFERNKKGILQLPPMTDFTTVRQKQRVVRGYIGAVYRMSLHYMGLLISNLNDR